MGSETYKILEGLMFPDKPASLTITALFAKLTAHFEPKRLKIAEQYNFWQNKQGKSQMLAVGNPKAGVNLSVSAKVSTGRTHYCLHSWTSRRKHFS